MKELKNGVGVTVVFAFEYEIKEDNEALSRFVQFEQASIFSFYMDDDVDKIFIIDIENFMVVGNYAVTALWSPDSILAWNLETTLETYQELVDMGINDNVLIKVLNTRSRAWSYWSYCFDLTNATEADIAMILLRWKGFIYGKEEKSTKGN